MHPLPLGQLSASPWSLSSFWFIALALVLPMLLWLGLAWRRALLECPNRIRRAGIAEMRRLLKSVQRSDGPRPAHLHAWLRVSARVWNIQASAPCVEEVSQAVHALSGDPTVSSRWIKHWRRTEHGLYAPDAQPTQDWLQSAQSVAASVEMPKRQRLFPDRLGHWLPSIAGALMIMLTFGSTSIADVPWTAPAPDDTTVVPVERESASLSVEEAQFDQSQEPLPPEVAESARAALQNDWNDWAAHSNLAAFHVQQGELNRAIAHAAAAFVQHPSSSTTRPALLAALGETQSVDRSLRRLLSGAWYERAPTLLSPAGWQRLALLAALITAAGFCVLVCSLYFSMNQTRMPRSMLLWTGRGVAAAGALLLIAAVSSWNAYGAFSHPAAAILVRNANVAPVPTDLTPTEETSPLSAGTVVITGRSFLGWREVSGDPEIAGWIRDNAVMPLYARH